MQDVEVVRTEVNEILHEFLGNWRAIPYRWLAEIDVQVELVKLLNSRLNRRNSQYITAPIIGGIHGSDHPETFSRVTCGPYVRFDEPVKGGLYCKPDIVLWDDADAVPEGKRALNSGVWPVVAAIEIKYTYGTPVDDWDFKKLSALVEQRRARLGFIINLNLTHEAIGNGIHEDNILGPNLMIYDVSLVG